jgi:4-hydroxy-tetrahydrodipicolinate synthase
MNENFHGIHTALVTPFEANKINFDDLTKMVHFQQAAGVRGFVVNGTTAESPTLSFSEAEGIFKHLRKIAKTSTLFFGTGSNSTQTTIETSQRAQVLGADALLVVVPYYNKPPQRGLYQHFANVAAAVQIPMFLYNVPGRTGVGLSPETIAELAKIKNIIGIKEASGDLHFLKTTQALCPKDFIFLSGDDGTADAFQSQGGHGVISVASHIVPKAMVEQKTAPYAKLIDLLFAEANPIPVKHALMLMGQIKSDELRLPLVAHDRELAKKLKEEMLKTGVLS